MMSTHSWVEIVGTVVPLSTLAGPLSGRPCVLYQVDLGLWQRLLEGGGATREVTGARFLVQRPGVSLLCDPSNARVQLSRRTVLSRRIKLGKDRELDRWLTGLYSRLHRDGPLTPTVRCRERRLRAGDRVRLRGSLEVVPASGGPLLAGYRQPPRRRLLRVFELSG